MVMCNCGCYSYYCAFDLFSKCSVAAECNVVKGIQAFSFPGAKSPQTELSLPCNFHSMEHSLIGTFAPMELLFLGSECSKNFRSYETVIP